MTYMATYLKINDWKVLFINYNVFEDKNFVWNFYSILTHLIIF